MRKVIKYNGLSMVDIAVQECGGVEGLFSIAQLNGYALDGTLTTDTLVKVDEAVEKAVRSTLPLFAAKPVVAQDKVTVQNGQSLADLCLQEYGSVEGMLALLRLNGLSCTADPATGLLLKIDLLQPADASVRKYYKDRRMVVNTGYTPVPSNLLLNDDGTPILNDDGSFILT